METAGMRSIYEYVWGGMFYISFRFLSYVKSANIAYRMS